MPKPPAIPQGMLRSKHVVLLLWSAIRYQHNGKPTSHLKLELMFRSGSYYCSASAVFTVELPITWNFLPGPSTRKNYNWDSITDRVLYGTRLGAVILLAAISKVLRNSLVSYYNSLIKLLLLVSTELFLILHSSTTGCRWDWRREV